MESETPIKDKLPETLEKGKPLVPSEPLEKTDNWSTAHSNLESQRKEAHEIALQKEQERFAMSHPYYVPKGSFEKEK